MRDANTGHAPVRDYPEPGSTFIQWKGTEVCMDLVCLCGKSFHVDDEFTYAVRCPYCSRVLRLGTQVAVAEADDSYSGVVVDVSVWDAGD